MASRRKRVRKFNRRLDPNSKAGNIRAGVLLPDQKNIDKSFEIISNVMSNFNPSDFLFINPSAGRGDFYINIAGDDKIAYDINPQFKGTIKKDFLDVDEIETDKKYKFFLGFPPTRQEVSYIEKSIELGADFIGYISTYLIDSVKNNRMLEENGYVLVKEVMLPESKHNLPDGNSTITSVYFVVITKKEHLPKLKVQEDTLTYGDIFDVYTINSNKLKVTEKTQPKLFRNNRVPHNSRTGKHYRLLIDPEGYKYYYQDGINLDIIKHMDIFIPLRVWIGRKEEVMKIYDSFDSKLFGGIAYGLEAKEGYKIEKSKTVEGEYNIYKEAFMGIFRLIGKMNSETIEEFYEIKQYNMGVLLTSKKKITNGRNGIL